MHSMLKVAFQRIAALEKKIEALERPRPKVLTLGQAAEYLGLNQETVLRRMRLGEIKGIKAGNKWRIVRAHLDEYLTGLVNNGRERL